MTDLADSANADRPVASIHWPSSHRTIDPRRERYFQVKSVFCSFTLKNRRFFGCCFLKVTLHCSAKIRSGLVCYASLAESRNCVRFRELVNFWEQEVGINMVLIFIAKWRRIWEHLILVKCLNLRVYEPSIFSFDIYWNETKRETYYRLSVSP